MVTTQCVLTAGRLKLRQEAEKPKLVLLWPGHLVDPSVAIPVSLGSPPLRGLREDMGRFLGPPNLPPSDPVLSE